MTFIDVDTLGNLRPISKIVFSLGSNVGDSLEILQGAVNALATTPDLIPVSVSSVYATAPVGAVQDQPDFYNLVLLAETTVEPLTLLERCNAIEEAFGRTRDIPGGPRTLDIDIIVFGKREIADAQLTVPHPEAARRAFVLVPWLEVEPKGDLAGTPLSELVQQVGDQGVRKTDEVIELP